MENYSILVADDQQIQRETLAELLEQSGYQVSTAASVGEAIAALDSGTLPDLILSDFKMPDGTGLDVAAKSLDLAPATDVMIMTAYADVQSVIQAMQLGVVDYLLKPLNMESLLRKIQLLAERRGLKREVRLLRAELNRVKTVKGSVSMTGSSPAIHEVQQIIEQLAGSRGTVLISGESGTGKEVAARKIHTLGAGQTGGRFVAINCAAIPENLLESELFGHKKGSFTGATSDKDGLFVVANRGTLFLDEIGEMPKGLQVKLLRALQEREITPLGGTRPSKIDVQLIAATNRDLKREVEIGNFRQDLFYRINVVEVSMPPLRNRQEDIPELVEHLMARLAIDLRKPKKLVSNEVLQALTTYTWPGNVRELANVLERALILSKTPQIQLADLPESCRGTTTHQPDQSPLHGMQPLDLAVRDFTKKYILEAIQQSNGSKKDAAKILGVGLSSLYRKLEDLGIPE